jgi:CBS domain-containing protein
MNVRDIMTADPRCCTLGTPVPEVARLMVENDCGEIPVIDESTRRLEGFVTDRDLVCRVLATDRVPGSVTAREAMSSPVVTVTPETTIAACCELMETNQIRRVPVIDSDGRCCGIVSQADVAREAPSRETAQVVKGVSRPGTPLPVN